MSMQILYFLIPVAFIFMALLVWGIVWTVKNDQYDDLEGPAHRILMDDDDPRIPTPDRRERGSSKRAEDDLQSDDK